MISKELIKGSLKPIILKLLKEGGSMYGYEISQKVESITEGKIKLTYGALYPILHKLEKDGLVVTETEMVNNRTRVYYKLTKTGISSAKEKLDELQEFANTLISLLNPKPGLNTCTS